MAFSWQESVKPAGTQDIQCDIEYLDKSYIHVYLDGAETTAFTWTSSTNIRLNSPLYAETAVLLIRKTEREYLYIEFASGAPFIEGNVDTQNTQFLHLAQELVEGRSIEGFYGDINMHRYRITNLGDPVDARDAANRQYVDAGDARLDQRIDAEHAAWVAAVDNEASIRKAADDALDVRTTNLEQTYFNANTNSFPWWTVTTSDTNTITPGMHFTKAKVRLNGVTQTAGYSYTVAAGVITFAETIPAGTLVDVTIGVDTDADTSAVSNVLQLLGADKGTTYVGTLGDKPLIAISHLKHKGMSDQAAMQTAFASGYPVLVDADVTLTSTIVVDRSAPLDITYKPGVVVTNSDFLPRLVSHPQHKTSGRTFKMKKGPELTSTGGPVSHQTMSVEMAVHDVVAGGPGYEPYVALLAGIESFNCELQKLWGMNILTNAHNMRSGDEVYGVEIDCNVDGVVDGGNYVGAYIAGAGDLSTSAGADGVRVQRLRDGTAKWNCGVRIFDTVTGIRIVDSTTYSIFAEGSAPIVRRKTAQNGGWAFIHTVSASSTPWGVDDYGDTYSRRLYLGTGNGKAKNRVNLDGGVKFYTTNAAVSWGAIPVNGYVDKNVTELVGINIEDWTNFTLDVTPIGYGGAMPVVAVQAYISSDKTQAYVRVINISGNDISNCNLGLNVKLSGHSATN